MKRALLILIACVACIYARAENRDSLFAARLSCLPFQIELPYQPVVGTYIQRYLNNRVQVNDLLDKAENYFPMIWDELDKRHLPYELCYLTVIESMLNPSVKSSMGAAGLWQLMPVTGRLYGLTVNSQVDERLNTRRCTQAACACLERLYEEFHDWEMALTAYNCGAGTVKRALAQSGGKKDYWSIYPYLPEETRNFLPHYMAVCYVMNYAE